MAARRFDTSSASTNHVFHAASATIFSTDEHASVLLLAIRQFGDPDGFTACDRRIDYRDTAATHGFADVARLIGWSIYDARGIEWMTAGSLTLLGRLLSLW